MDQPALVLKILFKYRFDNLRAPELSVSQSVPLSILKPSDKIELIHKYYY